MHNMALLFCGIFFTLAFSFTGLILSSNNQFGALKQTTETLEEDGSLVEGEPLYPRKEGGLALQGKQVYIEMGCIYCHSQQIRRPGFGADIDRSWGPRTVARDYYAGAFFRYHTHRRTWQSRWPCTDCGLASPALIQSANHFEGLEHASICLPL